MKAEELLVDKKVQIIFKALKKRFPSIQTELADYEHFSLLKAMQTFDESKANFYTYLTAIHKHRAIQLLKQQKNSIIEYKEVERSYINKGIEGVDTKDFVDSLLSSLNSDELYVIKEYIWNTRSMEEIGQMMNITCQAVSKKINKILEKLRNVRISSTK